MAGAVPGTKYLYVTIKDKQGRLKRVAMERSKALALRRQRGVQQTTGLIPKPLRDAVDAGGIYDAVQSHIQSLNAPLDQLKTQAQTQFDTNVRMNDQLGQQTQASLDQLLANADTRQKDYAALAGEVVAAQQAANQRAAQGTSAVLGAALNPLVAQRVDAAMQPANAMQFAQASQGAWADRLGQQAQRDFFERGKGIQAITQQAFNEGQRRNLANTLQQVAAQQAANQQQRADLTRQYAQEDYALASAFGQAQQDAAQQAFENNLASYQAETDRIDALGGGGGGSGGGGGALSTNQQKAMTDIRKQVDKLVQSTRKPTQITQTVDNDGDGKPDVDANGKPITVTTTQQLSVADAFGTDGGPWRKAFTLLTGADVGIGAGKAALVATSWYPGSITRSTPAKIQQMLKRREVPVGIQKQIITRYFGDKAWSSLTAPSSSRPGTYWPNPSGTTPQDQSGTKPREWLAKLRGKKVKTDAGAFQLLSFSNGKWQWRGPNGKVVQLKWRSGVSPVMQLRNRLKGQVNWGGGLGS